MATCTMIEIPKTTSGPADPHAPSILTTLPPEIRNRIYEYLFKKDVPVLPTDGHADAKRLRQSVKNIGHEQTIDSPDGGVEPHLGVRDFRHGFQDCTRLLLSCRQIYHEAVGILYGENIFLFSRALSNQVWSVSTWLSSIGSHYHLLSRVHIDADAYRERHYKKFDLLPLLKLVWIHPHAKCKIVFAPSGWPLPKHRRAYRALSSETADPIPSINFMNRVLFTLGTKDALSLKQYARYPRLVPSIVIQMWYGQRPLGYISLKDAGTPRRFGNLTKVFDISDQGEKAEWRESSVSNLLDLPFRLLSDINTYVRASEARVVFDLDNEQVEGFQAGLHGVNRHLRQRIDREPGRSCDEIEFKMSTQEAVTDFKSFIALRRCLDIKKFRDLMDLERRPKRKRSVKMVLMFDLSTPKPIEDLRINITELLAVFRCGFLVPTIAVQESNSGMTNTETIILHSLRWAAFLLLSDILDQFPAKADQPPPEIWIDGHGTVLHATYPATDTSAEEIIPHLFTDKDPVSFSSEGWRIFKIVENRGIWAKNCRPEYPDTIEGRNIVDLLDLWRHLRFCLWYELRCC